MGELPSWTVPADTKRADLFSICGINVTKGRVTGKRCVFLTSLEVFWFLSGFPPFQLPLNSNWELKLREVSVSPSVSLPRNAVWSKMMLRGRLGAGAPASLPGAETAPVWSGSTQICAGAQPHTPRKILTERLAEV